MRNATLLCVVLALVPAPAAVAETETERLDELFQNYHEWQLDEFPSMAMARGDYSQAHRLGDTGLDAIERRHRETQRYRRQLRSIDPGELNAADKLNFELFELRLTNAIDGYRFRAFLAPIGGRYGPQQRIPQMAERVRFESEAAETPRA